MGCAEDQGSSRRWSGHDSGKWEGCLRGDSPLCGVWGAHNSRAGGREREHPNGRGSLVADTYKCPWERDVRRGRARQRVPGNSRPPQAERQGHPKRAGARFILGEACSTDMPAPVTIGVRSGRAPPSRGRVGGKEREHPKGRGGPVTAEFWKKQGVPGAEGGVPYAPFAGLGVPPSRGRVGGKERAPQRVVGSCRPDRILSLRTGSAEGARPVIGGGQQ